MGTTPSFVIDAEFQSLCPAPLAEEIELLEASIVEEGIREPIRVWSKIIVDGHNRWEICQRRGISCPSKPIFFDSREQAREWIIRNQLGRRNLSAAQRSYLRGILYNSAKSPRTENIKKARETQEHQNDALGVRRGKMSKNIAAAHGVGAATIERDGKFAAAVDAIGAVDSGAKAAILTGSVKGTAKDVAALASLPDERRRDAGRRISQGKVATVREALDDGSVITDELDTPVPDCLRDVFSAVEKWKDAANRLKHAIGMVTALVDTGTTGWLDVAETIRLIKQARVNLRFAMPFTECPKCRRKPVTTCQHCKGTGWLNETGFGQCATEADKTWAKSKK